MIRKLASAERPFPMNLRRTFSSQTCAIAYLVEEEHALMVFDHQGTLIIEHPWPEPGTRYVGSGRPRGRRTTL